MARQHTLLPSEWAPHESIELDSAGTLKQDGPEELFARQCRSYRLPAFVTQLRFAKAIGRQWRFDFAWPQYRVAVEIEGLCVMPRCRRCYPRELVVLGGHASIQGIKRDIDKYNAAIGLLDWRPLRFQQKDIRPGHAINMTMRVLARHGWKGPNT